MSASYLLFPPAIFLDVSFSLVFLLHKNNKIIKTNKIPVTQPITIPAIAPPDKLFLFPFPLEVTLQRAKGLPQSELPSKAEAGLLDSHWGIDPFNWLKETLICSSEGRSNSGMEPVR
uniref:Uncharacterized protein n=1 Tax=Rhizophora mucronata TaxID=61149 RepID=A0A2P2PLZ8_RHIMU